MVLLANNDMGKIIKPKPVKLIMSIISSIEGLFSEAKVVLSDYFGPIDMESPYQWFDFTDYYLEEMGPNLKQKLISFNQLIPPNTITNIKAQSNQLEIDFSRSQKPPNSMKNNLVSRPINFDPGYLTLNKFILASTKNGPARIYIDQGIYAEITLQFFKQSFQGHQWTYQNYQTTCFIDFLNSVRKKYKEQLKGL